MNDSTDKSQKALIDLIERQTRAISRLEEHFAPESLEEVEERRLDRLRSLLIRVASIGALVVSGTIGAWEFGTYLKENWEMRVAAENYAEVGLRLYYEEGNDSVAKDFIDKALELNPDNADYLYLDAFINGMSEVRTLFNLDRPYTSAELDAAYRAIAKSILLEQQDREAPEAFILRGQIYAALRDFDRARDSLGRAIERDPASDFALMRLGVVEYSDGNVKEAIKLFDRALGLNQSSKWAHLWKGIVFSETKDLSRARESLLSALEIDPRFDLALYNMGWLELKRPKKNYETAESYFRKALAVNPSYKEALYGLGMVYGYQNQYEIAHSYLSKALDINPGFLTAWKWRGIVSYEMKNFEAAVDDFSNGLALDPANADLFARRGRTHFLAGNGASALQDLLLARKFTPENSRIMLYLAEVYHQQGESTIALETLSEALTLNPDYADALALQGEIYRDQNKLEDAESSYRKALDATQYRPERYLVPLAQILMDQDKVDIAYKLIDARQKEINSAEFWRLYFNLAIKTGQTEAAEAALASFVKLAPNSPDISDMRKSIE